MNAPPAHPSDSAPANATGTPPANAPGTPPAIRWEAGELRLLDQRLLPHRVDFLRIDGIPDAVDAIATLAVRGAPAIGMTAAYALAVAAGRSGDVAEVLREGGDALIAARPTAVNLRWAVQRLRRRGAAEPSAEALADEAEAIHREDRRRLPGHRRARPRASSAPGTTCSPTATPAPWPYPNWAPPPRRCT